MPDLCGLKAHMINTAEIYEKWEIMRLKVMEFLSNEDCVFQVMKFWKVVFGRDQLTPSQVHQDLLTTQGVGVTKRVLLTKHL
jgi:hypothetical protein